ncbi:MAG: hypothetical protein S4CHLAM102_14230 [Chlamydiia bacterium]|nr:hypothetical protein [Chlamydiia bacterium]
MSQVREHWSSRLGFIMAAIGSAIGLGILWKFPYVVGQNGGGLFLFTYLFAVALIGVPLFIGEILLGRMTQSAAIGAFSHEEASGSWKVGAFLGIASSFLIMSFYSVIAGWGLSYVVMSLTGFYQGLALDQIPLIYEKLSKSGGITVMWHFLFTAICMGIVFAGVRKGIEYWSQIMVKILLVLLLILFSYSLTLKGLHQAVQFVFYPNWDKFKVSSMLEALGLAFFTLSLGQGIMISYGSYMKGKENVVKTSAIVGLSVITVAFLAALTIFPVVFSFDLSPDAGLGMVFQTLPFLFAQLPGSLVLSTIFFSLFVFTAITSAVPLIEVCATNLMEKAGLDRHKAVVLVSAGTFLFGIPSALAQTGWVFPMWEKIFGINFLETMDRLVSVWLIPLAGLITSLYVGWKVDRRELREQFMRGHQSDALWSIWYGFMRYVIPVIVFCIILQKSGILDLSMQG